MAKKLKEFVTQIVDKSTGELIGEDIRTFVRKVTNDEFIQVFLTDLQKLFSINGKIEHGVLTLLWKDSLYNINKIIVIKSTKVKYAEVLSCDIRSIDNALTSLVKKDLLIREAQSTYFLNPKYFFKGETDKRKVIISYLSGDNGELKPNILFEEEGVYNTKEKTNE